MTERIRFDIELSRVIEVLARQIYQSPLALLRENTQNAYDAILLRKQLSDGFEPKIEIDIGSDQIRVRDNGIGMTADDLRHHFWRAGSSSKNNDAARAAGVVGTFGIGAMANFGIADELQVLTESARTGERTLSQAQRNTLSVTQECIDLISETPTGQAGTEITAKIRSGHAVSVSDATSYIQDFLRFVTIDVTVNNNLISRRPLEEAVPRLAPAWTVSDSNRAISQRLSADFELIGAATGELWIRLENLILDGISLPGVLLLRQSLGVLKTFRSGFGLATANVSSAYGFGGVADFLFLQPTAGREALETSSIQTLQLLVSDVDAFCSSQLASHPESDSNSNFMNWVVNNGRYELCKELKVRSEPSDGLRLKDLEDRPTEAPVLKVYSGSDPAVIKMYASDEVPLVILARSNPRRQCEFEFLRRYCRFEEVSDNPRVLTVKPVNEWSLSESAFAFRIVTILDTDYFLKARVEFGQMSHGLPLLASVVGGLVAITLDPSSSTTALVISVYETDYHLFGSLVKDFVRNIIFPKISEHVPSSTRQGAEAFLKTIRRPREIFEYESSDLADLTSIWQDVIEGKITVERATELSMAAARSSVQVVDATTAAQMSTVAPDIAQNEASIQPEPEELLSPAPAVSRPDRFSSAKLLLIGDGEAALRGYRCFLAVTEKVREEHGSFFLQPHRTSVVWGGQKVVFIFQHHSGRFGLYYDLQSSELVAPETGGGVYPTYTIALANAIYIPIPEPIRTSFVPRQNERKRFEIRCEILHILGGDST